MNKGIGIGLVIIGVSLLGLGIVSSYLWYTREYKQSSAANAKSRNNDVDARQSQNMLVVVLLTVAIVTSLLSLGVSALIYTSLQKQVDTYVSAHKDELRGEKGDKGDTGERGPQGYQGVTGATGATGSSGYSSGGSHCTTSYIGSTAYTNCY